MNISFILIILLCLVSSSQYAQSLNGYTKSVVYGEKDLGDYNGIHDNVFEIGAYGRIHSQDKKLSDTYIESLFMPGWFEISNFASEELAAGIFCSDNVMAKHFEHIKYYYRLIALSYLNESLRLLESRGDCSVNISKVLNSCKPKTSWMKQLIDLTRVAPALKVSRLDPKRFISMRSEAWCEQRGEHCSNQIFAKKQRLKKICGDDEKAFIEICSERDELYGISNQTIPYWLLKRTHIVDQFSSEEQALGCLRRYSQMMAPIEKQLSGLGSIFDAGFESLPDRYSEGVLFAYGALQEFGELTRLFKDSYAVNENKAFPVSSKKQEKLIFKKEDPKIMLKKLATIKIPVAKRVKIKNTHSAFYEACEHRKKYKLTEASVDMQKFHYDLLLKGEKKERAHKLLSKFRQRKVLKMMKQHENLGKATAPVPLVFIKYLLDTQDHQGMFNIVGVLGNNFYIRNDFDKDETKCRNEYSRFYYDRNLAKWQLSMIKKEKKIKN